jgi:S-DNA-T family DNA segregation ATPase FtsK/SpoIIIE
MRDVVGFILIITAVLLLLAQVSFDREDLAVNRFPPNQTPHNWIGTAGAVAANGLFFLAGAGAFLIPFLLLGFGLSYLVDAFAYLKRRWAWTAVLFLSSLGFFDLYTTRLAGLQANLNAPSAGGLIGQTMNDLVFRNCGVPGATIIFFTVYIVSLVFLTNFRLSTWLRNWFVREPREEESPDWTPEERTLARKARDLEKQARRLQEQVERSSGLGADLKPVPAPTVRDLSVPQSRPSKASKAKPVEPEVEKSGLEGEVITAREIQAATTADILGKVRPKPGEGEPAEDSEKAAATKDSEKPDAAPAPAAAESVNVIDNSSGKAKRPRKKPLTVAAAPAIGDYRLPPMDFLQYPDSTFKPTESKEELMANARLMQQTLAQFGIEVALGDITKGPTITRYELHPAPGVKLERISALNNNIAAALKAERIHILAPVPGKSSVGVEVPNAIKTKVIMRDLLEAEEWQKSKARVPLALGKDVYGHPIIADLADMPHLLIAGSTGSGKSVCINAIIASLLYRFPPDQLRFVMIDPKVVELQHYNALPHLVVPVVTDPKKVILALRWVVNEMEKRYQIFARVGVRNIQSFNTRSRTPPVPSAQQELPLMQKKEKIEPGADGFAVEVDEEMVAAQDEDIVIPEKLSYIVVIIDELADLMLVAPADVEMAIARITQMARAAGIHCIVATQRPSVDVITGVIKANIPARIAFQVASRVDSRTILDAMGADKLLGKGDMLYLPPGAARFIRAQGALITDQEIQTVVDFIAKQGKPTYELEIHQQLQKPVNDFEGGGSDEDEEIIQQCIEVIRSEQKASVSLLQRRLRLGYGRAARIMDELEDRGIVGPSKGAEPRDILIDLDGGGADGRPPTSESS